MTDFVTARGSIFHSKAEVLVNPVNCEGVMGAGLAKQFAATFPEMLREYKRDCNAGALKPGKVRLYTLNTGQSMAAFPTKDQWSKPSRMEYVTTGLADLSRQIAETGIESIAMPPVGCGLGGLDWERVKPEILKLLQVRGLTVYLYEPSKHR